MLGRMIPNGDTRKHKSLVEWCKKHNRLILVPVYVTYTPGCTHNYRAVVAMPDVGCRRVLWLYGRWRLVKGTGERVVNMYNKYMDVPSIRYV